MRSRAGDPVVLRAATGADVEFIFATERLPGFDILVGRWDRNEHEAALVDPNTRYLIGGRPGADKLGFAILQPLRDAHEGAKLKRIAVTEPGSGFGLPFLSAIVDFVFTNTDNERLWLDVFVHNERARHVYRRAGLTEDGRLRQAYRMPDGGRADRVIMSVLRREWR